jgi:iron transport multicopper oxidase
MQVSLLVTLFSALASSTLAATQNYNFNVLNANIAPDGFDRSAVTVNGVFPGPLISANKGDTVNVSVHCIFFWTLSLTDY